MSPPRKPRHTRPSAVERIAAKFEGYAAVSYVCGVSRAAVSLWNTPKSVNKKGNDGIIPARYHAKLIAAAKRQRIKLRPAELVNV